MAKKFLTGIDNANQRIVNLADPSTGTDAVTKQYADALISGIQWHASVVAATTTNGALATAYANGQVIDGVTLATGNRILVKNQTTQTENGIYVVAASGAPTRATDANTTAGLTAATVLVTGGTVGLDTAWTQSTAAPTVGTSNIVFVQFGGVSIYTADGNALKLTGTQFAVSLDNTGNVTFSQSASGLKASVDSTLVARTFRTTTGTSLSNLVTHNLGSKDVVVSLRQVSDDSNVMADVVYTTVNSVTITFAVAPGAGTIGVVITG